MKKLLMNFADNVLSREQMKSLKGGDGYTCYTYTTYSDGQQIENEGECAGSSRSECESYADESCNTNVELGGEGTFCTAGCN